VIVVDTNFVAYLYLPREHTRFAEFGVRLATADAKILRAFPRQTIALGG
jgi:hypothetical protein